MPNVTGFHKSGRGRPTLEQIAAYKETLENAPKLFDTEPFVVEKKNSNVKYPDVPIENWTEWVYNYLIINKNCFSLLDIYEDENIEPPMSLLDLTNLHDPDIECILEQRIINKVLKGEIKSVFAQALLKQKFNWTEEPSSEVSLDGPIEFNFG